MSPAFFKTPAELRKWFQKNHDKEKELLVGFYKVDSGKPSITWSQSVDEALCFGWIDGVRKGIDEESYSIRFTPRKPSSIWSAVNINKMDSLLKQGLVHQAGIEAFARRKENKSKIYSYEKKAVQLDEAYEKELRANKKAWGFFQYQAPWYRKAVFNWIMSAKQEATRRKRLAELIEDSEAGRKIKSLSYTKKK